MSNFVPECGPVVAWINAYLTGTEAPDDVLHGIVSAGAAPFVDGIGSGAHPWVSVLAMLKSGRVSALRLALAAPGDLGDLPGPPDFNRTVLGRGQCAVCVQGVAGALVPTSEESWSWFTVADSRPRGMHVNEATRALAEAISASAEELERLDVARGRDDVDQVLAHIDDELATLVLPSSLPQRALTLIRRGVQISAAMAVAGATQGGALTVAEVERRSRALNPVARTARRAIEAGFSAIHD